MLLLLLAGCACPTFEEMEVVDLTVEADPDMIERIHGAIADFAAWNGGEGVCVPRVEINAELRDGDHDIAGVYQGPYMPILVEDDAAYSVVIHELCHAADEELGEISVERGELYPGDGVDPEGYPSVQLRQNEDFARLCEDGPEEMALIDAAGDACGADLLPAGERLIRERVYPRYAPSVAGGLEVTFEVHPLSIPWGWRPVAATGLESTALVLLASDAGRRPYRVVEVDPYGGEILREIRLEGPGGWSLDDAWWVPHPQAPILRLDSRAALRYDAAAGALTRFDFPRVPGRLSGFLLYGQHQWAQRYGALWRRAEATGGWEALGPPPLERDVDQAGMLPAIDGVLLWIYLEDGGEELWRWTEGGWAGPAPRPPDVWPRLGLADGRVLGRWGRDAGEEEGIRGGLAIYDPRSGEWRFATAVCGPDAAPAIHAELVIGGEPWILQGDEDRAHRALTRVILEE